MIKLATSDSAVQGGAGNLTLTDKDGNVISDGVVADIEQNGDVVAKGTYDYRLTGGENDDGLYINYGLTQVELLASGSNALVLDANGKTGNAADLSARVTGSGDWPSTVPEARPCHFPIWITTTPASPMCVAATC